MNYYKSYSINNVPFCALNRVKEYMRDNSIKEAEVMVNFHRRGSGQIDIVKIEKLRVKPVKK